MVVCERERENMSLSTEYIVYSVILIFHYSKCIEFSKSRMGFLMSFQHLCSNNFCFSSVNKVNLINIFSNSGTILHSKNKYHLVRVLTSIY